MVMHAPGDLASLHTAPPFYTGLSDKLEFLEGEKSSAPPGKKKEGGGGQPAKKG